MQTAPSDVASVTPPAGGVAKVRLPKASYLVRLASEGGVLRRRQELPEEAFITVDELKALYGEGNRDGVLPIVGISFCWDTPPHPDPRGKQLATVAAALERESGPAKGAGSEARH